MTDLFDERGDGPTPLSIEAQEQLPITTRDLASIPVSDESRQQR